MAYKKVIYLGLDYSEFEKGIRNSNQRMKDLDDEFKNFMAIEERAMTSTEKFTAREENLKEMIEVQTKVVEDATIKLNSLRNSQDASEAKVKSAEKSLDKQRIALMKLQDAMSDMDFTKGLDDCNVKLEKLNREYELTEATMSSFDTATDKLKRKHQYLSEQFEIQKEKVEEYRKEYERLKEEYGDSEYVQSVRNALMQEQVELRNLQNELEGTRIKAAGVKESMTALGLVFTSISALYLGASKSVADYADNLVTMSNETHIATDTLQEWAYAADLIDVSVDTMTGSIRKMTNNMQTAATGSGEASKAFTKLGVKITDVHGNMRDSEEVFYDVIDALGKVKNETERDQLAMDIFGKSATELAGAISAGSDGLKEYGDKARELGLIMSDEALTTAVGYKDALDKLDSAFEAMKNNLGMVLIPILTDFVNAIAAIPAPVLSSIVVILSIVATIVSLVSAIKSLRATGDSLKTLYNMVTKGLDNTYAKIILLTLSIGALVAMLVVLTGKGTDAVNLIESLGSFGGMNRFQTGHNARGTKYFPGGSTWVGENGPEIAEFPPGTRIYNNQESNQIAGGNTYYITMNMDLMKLKTVNDVVEAVSGLAGSLGGGGAINA